ncbi:hypothetical protein D3C73_631540 [compost metagenome]
MVADIISKIFFSTIEFGMLILLSFTLFRIPLRVNLSRVIGIAFVLSVLSYFLRDVAGLGENSVFGFIVTYTILVRFLFAIPFFYASLFCITGYLGFVIVQALLAMIGVISNMTTFELIESSRIDGIALQLASSLVVGIIIWIMQHKKLGFLFIIKHISIKEAVQGYNVFLVAINVILVILLQLTAFAIFSQNKLFIYVYILLGILPFLLVGLYITYKHNRKQIDDKYMRLNKRGS